MIKTTNHFEPAETRYMKAKNMACSVITFGMCKKVSALAICFVIFLVIQMKVCNFERKDEQSISVQHQFTCREQLSRRGPLT